MTTVNIECVGKEKKLLHKLTSLLKFLMTVLKRHVHGVLTPNREVQGGMVRLILNELCLGRKEGLEFFDFLADSKMSYILDCSSKFFIIH